MHISTYITLYTPALDFILEATTCKVNDSVLTDLLSVCHKYNNR